MKQDYRLDPDSESYKRDLVSFAKDVMERMEALNMVPFTFIPFGRETACIEIEVDVPAGSIYSLLIVPHELEKPDGTTLAPNRFAVVWPSGHVTEFIPDPDRDWTTTRVFFRATSVLGGKVTLALWRKE